MQNTYFYLFCIHRIVKEAVMAMEKCYSLKNDRKGVAMPGIKLPFHVTLFTGGVK